MTVQAIKKLIARYQAEGEEGMDYEELVAQLQSLLDRLLQVLVSQTCEVAS